MATVTTAPETKPEQSIPEFPPHPPRPRGGFRRRIPRIAAITATVAGVLTLVSAATRPFEGRMRLIQDLVPLDARLGARFLTALVGIVLILLARQLDRRKRRAWIAATIASALLVISHTVKGLDVEEAGVHLALFALLVYGRREFYAKSDPPSLSRLVRFIPLFFSATFVYGVSLLVLNRRSLDEEMRLGAVIATVLRAMVGLEGPIEITRPIAASFFTWSLSALTAIGVIASIYLFFRPVLEGYVSHPDERERAHEIVHEWGTDTLAYFVLRDDKNYFFSRDGDAVIAYRYLNGIACISGDPVGNPKSIPGMLVDFQDEAWNRGWKIAVLAGREDHASLYQPFRLKTFYLGDEAIVDLESFSLEGRKIRKVRQSCHRLVKAGYTTELHPAHDADSELNSKLDAITHKWRGKAPERGFSMALGRPISDEDSDCLLLVARDESGEPRGFLRLVPFFGELAGYSLDQMRRDPETPNGLTEFMVVSACNELKEQGYKRLSLNFAAFARIISGEIELTPWQRLQRMIVMRVNPYFQIESLLRFNAKFHPIWVPRCIYYEEGVNLVRVGLSYLEVEAFLRLGFLRRGLLPHLDLVKR